MAVQDAYPIEPPPRRHPAVETFKVFLIDRAAAVRMAATRLEHLVTMMPDDDALFEHAATDFVQATLGLRDTLDRYRFLRDIEGMS